MAIIKSGATSDTLTVDPTSKAARVTLYRSDGVEIMHRPTYSGTIATWTIPATPTDLVVLGGSASKTIRVIRVRVTGNQTTAGINVFFLIKRGAADTSGTPVAITPVPHDSNDSAVSASLNYYTANPTINNTIGSVRTRRMLCPAPAGTTNDEIIWDFDGINEKPVVLRGTAQQLALNFNGAALPTGMVLSVTMEWTEE